MNDNFPPREKVQAAVLTATILAEENLIHALPKVLAEHRISAEAQADVESLVRPVLERMRGMENLVLAYTRDPGNGAGLVVETFSKVISRMEQFARDFSGEAETPEQTKTATAFQRFVEGVGEAWKEPTKAREREGPELERE